MPLPKQRTFDSGSELVSGSAWPDGIVWHYTNGVGLAGMVGGKVLWASSMAFMNDVGELQTERDIFCNILKTHAGDVDADVRGSLNTIVRDALNVSSYRTFIACASLQPNRLTMWRNYTGEVGYAVALDKKAAPNETPTADDRGNVLCSRRV